MYWYLSVAVVKLTHLSLLITRLTETIKAFGFISVSRINFKRYNVCKIDKNN